MLCFVGKLFPRNVVKSSRLNMKPTQPTSPRRAIFIDRDGTLNEEVGYVCSLDEFRLYDFAAESVRLINEAGWLAIVVTSQAGVARGMFSEDFLAEVHNTMTAQLARKGARLDAIYYCPHHPDVGSETYRRECDCRKPKPGMLHRAAADFNLDLTECVVIGDRFRDFAMAQAVGGSSVLVLTGYGKDELEQNGKNWPQQPDCVAENLLEAVRWIINNPNPKS
jgi:D-glycero-D-manno-heptose 1,7-bisphosphate phosphatase